jgi:4-amino-4-deoxy-L-arabinose transferase
MGFGVWDLGFGIFLCIAALLYLAPLLLNAPLTDPDEGLHAAISQEMVERGDLIVPRFVGRAFFDKPILFFWAQAASMRLFGMSTSAARLPGMMFALLGIATTGWLAGVLFANARHVSRGELQRVQPAGPPIGWLAAGCYATMVLPFVLAQAPVHDIALVPFTNVALGWLWRSRDPGSGIRDPILAGCALGLSILTKGLAGLAMVGVGFAVYLLVTRTLTRRLVVLGILTLVVAVLVAVPWYLAMNAREPGYLRYYFLNRHLLGFTTETQRHGGQPWWYYVPVVVAGGLPWIVHVRTRLLSDAPGKFLWMWLAASLVLLSLSNSKAVTYALPVIPAVAIVAARSDTVLRQWRPLAIAMTIVYVGAIVTAGPTVAYTHSSTDLTDHFNTVGRLPASMFVMENRVAFVYYLRPDVRARMHREQIQNFTLDELEAIRPFPSDAVLALPADLADARLKRLPQLANGHRQRVGRYVLLSPAAGRH